MSPMINRRGGNECRPSDPKQSEAPHKKLEEEKQQQKLRAEYSTSPDDFNRISTRHALFRIVAIMDIIATAMYIEEADAFLLCVPGR